MTYCVLWLPSWPLFTFLPPHCSVRSAGPPTKTSNFATPVLEAKPLFWLLSYCQIPDKHVFLPMSLSTLPSITSDTGGTTDLLKNLYFILFIFLYCLSIFYFTDFCSYPYPFIYSWFTLFFLLIQVDYTIVFKVINSPLSIALPASHKLTFFSFS